MDNLDIQENLKIILDESSNLSLNEIRRLLNKMSSSEIAHALESSPPKQRSLLFSLLKLMKREMFFQISVKRFSKILFQISLMMS
jgi:Mg/Co/Ni transporter MgtE